MNCPPLAATGPPVLAVLGLAGLLLAAGVALMLVSRSARGRTATVVLALLVIGGSLFASDPITSQARAASRACANRPGSDSGTGAGAAQVHLTIVQTSTMGGLAPGVAPVSIAGRITNHGTASTFVAAVTVSISGVTASVPGCDASDFVLLDTVMPVGRTLAPGGSAGFAGARIGFHNKTINQDVCQHALVNLRYVSSQTPEPR